MRPDFAHKIFNDQRSRHILLVLAVTAYGYGF